MATGARFQLNSMHTSEGKEFELFAYFAPDRFITNAEAMGKWLQSTPTRKEDGILSFHLQYARFTVSPPHILTSIFHRSGVKFKNYQYYFKSLRFSFERSALYVSYTPEVALEPWQDLFEVLVKTKVLELNTGPESDTLFARLPGF
jgi:hypothetical protein